MSSAARLDPLLMSTKCRLLSAAIYRLKNALRDDSAVKSWRIIGRKSMSPWSIFTRMSMELLQILWGITSIEASAFEVSSYRIDSLGLRENPVVPTYSKQYISKSFYSNTGGIETLRRFFRRTFIKGDVLRCFSARCRQYSSIWNRLEVQL